MYYTANSFVFIVGGDTHVTYYGNNNNNKKIKGDIMGAPINNMFNIMIGSRK